MYNKTEVVKPFIIWYSLCRLSKKTIVFLVFQKGQLQYEY